MLIEEGGPGKVGETLVDEVWIVWLVRDAAWKGSMTMFEGIADVWRDGKEQCLQITQRRLRKHGNMET